MDTFYGHGSSIALVIFFGLLALRAFSSSDAAGVRKGVHLPRACSPNPLIQVKALMPSTARPARSHSPGSLLVGLRTPQADMSGGTGRDLNGRSTLQTVVSRAPTYPRATLVARRPRTPRTLNTAEAKDFLRPRPAANWGRLDDLLRSRC